MAAMVGSESAPWKQRMSKNYTVEEVEFLGVGHIGLFSYEKRFPESSAKSLEVPDQAQTTERKPGTSDW